MPRLKSSARKATTRQRFVSEAAKTRFTEIFAPRELHMEKGFLLGNHMPPYLPDYVLTVIEERGWQTFAQHPCGVNVSVVREFYSNFAERDDNVVTVREFNVDVSAERINSHLGLVVEVDEYALVSAHIDASIFTIILSTIGIAGAQWVMTTQGKHRLPRASLNAPAKVWYHFLATRLLPTSQGNMVQEDRAILLFCILTGKSINVGRLISQELADCAGKRKGKLFFPSLLTALCDTYNIPTTSLDEEKANSAPIDQPCLARLLGNTPMEDEDSDMASTSAPPMTEASLTRLFQEQNTRIEHMMASHMAAQSQLSAALSTELAAASQRINECIQRQEFEERQRIRRNRHDSEFQRSLAHTLGLISTRPLPRMPRFPPDLYATWQPPAVDDHGPQDDDDAPAPADD